MAAPLRIISSAEVARLLPMSRAIDINRQGAHILFFVIPAR